MEMKLETYKNIMSVIQSFRGPNYECEELLKQKFPEIMPETLGSIYEIFYQKKMKKIHAKYSRLSKDLYNRYKTAVENLEPVGILVKIADEIELSPALLARIIMEEYYQEAIQDYIIPKITDDSDNSGRCNERYGADDSIRSDDTGCSLTDDDQTDSGSTDIKLTDELVESTKDSKSHNNEIAEVKKAGVKSLDDRQSSANNSIEMKSPKTANATSSKNSSKHSREIESIKDSKSHNNGIAEAKKAGIKNLNDRQGSANNSMEMKSPKNANATSSKKNSKHWRERHKGASNNADKVNDKKRNIPAKDEECSRITVSELINDTTLIKDPDLAYEVFLCHVEDDQYGPAMDCYRQSLGQQYEVRLLQWAKKNNLVIQDEASLRKFGFDKTPDIKLDLPISVNGASIMWIESKALFGDEETHQAYYKDQYIRYWNRFGPGLVIYWLGYLETIATPDERRILIRHDLPPDIKKYDPSCIKVRKLEPQPVKVRLFTEKPFGSSQEQ